MTNEHTPADPNPGCPNCGGYIDGSGNCAPCELEALQEDINDNELDEKLTSWDWIAAGGGYEEYDGYFARCIYSQHLSAGLVAKVYGETHTETKAKAHFVVEAVNNHDKLTKDREQLLEVCKKLAAALVFNCPETCVMFDASALAAVQQAIKAAERTEK